MDKYEVVINVHFVMLAARNAGSGFRQQNSTVGAPSSRHRKGPSTFSRRENERAPFQNYTVLRVLDLIRKNKWGNRTQVHVPHTQ